MHFMIYAGVIFIVMVYIAYFVFGNNVDNFDTISAAVSRTLLAERRSAPGTDDSEDGRDDRWRLQVVKQWNLLNGLDAVLLHSSTNPYLIAYGLLFTGLMVYFMLNFLLAIIVDAYQDEKKVVEDQVRRPRSLPRRWSKGLGEVSTLHSC